MRIIFVIPLILGIIFLSLVIYILTDGDIINGKVLQYNNMVGKELFNYKITHHRLPSGLHEINIKDKFCYLLKCYKVKYQIGENGQDYTVATKSEGEWVVYFRPNWAGYGISCVDQYKLGCADWGLAFEENYRGERTDFPIYRKTTPLFATPSAWPIL